MLFGLGVGMTTLVLLHLLIHPQHKVALRGADGYSICLSINIRYTENTNYALL